MSNQQYAAPSMEVVKFGHEDIVCVVSGWTSDGNPSHGSGVIEEDPNKPIPDDQF